MTPSVFAEANLTMSKPIDWTDEQCSEIKIYAGIDSDGNNVLISCWKPTPEERAVIAAGGPVWVTYTGGPEHAPPFPPTFIGGISPFQ